MAGTSSSNLRFAGDVQTAQLEIVGKNARIDVRHLMVNLTIFEDLFSPFITGNIVLNESLDLINKLPLIGEEYLEMHVFTPGFEGLPNKEFKGRFYIYKMGERTNTAERAVAYTLHFVSTEAIKDVNKKLYSAQAGYCHDIVRRILVEDQMGLTTIKTANIEETVNGIKFVANNWSPLACIQYATAHSLNRRNIGSFLFYENREGFNFISLSSLYSQESMQSFINDNYRRDIDSQGQATRNIQEDFKRVTEMVMPDGFDFVERIKSGMYKSNLTSYDFVTKRFKTFTYDGYNNFAVYPHLNNFPLTSGNALATPEAAHYNNFTHYGLHNGYGDTSSTPFFLQRKGMIAMAEAFKLEITVPGRTDYTVGKVVDLTAYRNEPIDNRPGDSDDKDPTLTGKYMVSTVTHRINNREHTCLMQLIKDSYVTDVENLQ